MTAEATRRFPIRYAIQRWNDGIWFYGSFLVVLLLLILIEALRKAPVLVYVPPLILDAAILIAFWLMRTFSYVELTADTLRIRNGTRRMDLPITSLARVRRQPLEVAFQPAERRRYVNAFVRRLAKQPAAYIRMDRRQDGLVEEAERRLGARLVAGADIVVPLVGTDEFVSAMKGRLKGRDNG